jgi:putative transcriptional regulator
MLLATDGGAFRHRDVREILDDEVARAQRALGNRLREERTRQGRTQAELAALVRVSRQAINTVENRVFVPSAVLSSADIQS